MPKNAMPMTFDEFRTSSEAVETDRPIDVAVRQQRQWFRDASFAEQTLQRALQAVARWVPWDPNGAPGA